MRKLIQTTALKFIVVLTASFLVSNIFLRVVISEEAVTEVAVEIKKIILLEEQKPYLTTPKNTFNYYCAPCHGDKGNGKGIYFTIDLEPKPRDLTDVEYMAKLTDDYLLNYIKTGSAAMGKSDLCPPWGGTFDEKRIKEIIGHIRSLTIAKSGSGEKAVTGTEDVAAAKASAADDTPMFIKWGVLIFLCLVCMFAARKEWKKLKSETESK
ncbi:MAG: cytochrome c [Candidatus Scalindua sp.]|nr:cytochrome c [Candidatus Scalindua sp.]